MSLLKLAKEQAWSLLQFKIGKWEKRVMDKVLKLDENNQCGYAMTEALASGSFK